MEVDSCCSSSQRSASASTPQQSQLDGQEKADIHQVVQSRSFKIQMKKGQEVRSYQHELAHPGMNGENYIVFAPTNSGKTLVAALVIANHLEKNPQCQRESPKVVVVVKTRLLADQQTKRLKEYIPGAHVECSRGIEGENADPSQQLPSVKEALPRSDIIVCTAGKLVDGLRKGSVGMRDFSLVVMDECHNTDKGSNYAQIMHAYLEQKVDGGCELLPQIVGLTATPGVGKNPSLNWGREVANLLTLCAHMDATSGIKYVQEHVEELNEVIPRPRYETDRVEQNEERHVFIRRLEQDMNECEVLLDFELDSNSPRWSQNYERKVKELRKSLEESDNPNNKNKISSVRVLECLTQTLLSYMDLPYALAMDPLKGYDELNMPDKLISDHDKQLQKMLMKLKSDLSSLPTCENPVLESVKKKLIKTFQENPKSEGIIFVQTREQAKAVSDWISVSKFSKEIGVRPHMLLGHKRLEEGGQSMTDTEQKTVLEAFRSGEYNLLVATSVAEEGLDIQQCNLVMRLHVSSAKSKAQMKGRARAEDSEIITIVSGDPKKLYKDMLNDEQLLLTEHTIRHILPLCVDDHFGHKISSIQRKIVENVRSQKLAEELNRITHPAKDVILKCKKCTVVACCGSDLYFIDNTNHCVVPGDVLRYETVEHHKPGIICSYNETSVIKKDYKVHCCGNDGNPCGTSWGVLGTWPTGKEFPVIKCECFNFFISGVQVSFKQWKKCPFKVSPLSKWFAENKN